MPSYACVPVAKARETCETALAVIDKKREDWKERLAQSYADSLLNVRIGVSRSFPFLTIRRPTMQEARDALAKGEIARSPDGAWRGWDDAALVCWRERRDAEGILEMCEESRRVMVADDEWIGVVKACDQVK